ncbi:MAG: NAD(P)/FAD-dependent oxidoreductase [Candidatus Krumholzibacteriia bacterium]
MSHSCDLAIIGAGPGGLAAALAGAEAGLRVVLVDDGALPGGNDAAVGRHAVRALIRELDRAAQVVSSSNLPPGTSGDEVEEPSPASGDFLMLHGDDLERRLAVAGVQRLRGRGRLLGPGRVGLRDRAGDDAVIEAARIVLATGSRPAEPFGLRADGDCILTSDQLLTREIWPRRLLVAGAGCVGVELAQLARRLGCQVTLLEKDERILPALEGECARAVDAACRRMGIVVKAAHRVSAVKSVGGAAHCRVLDIAGREERLVTADAVLLALGRQPATGDLGLESIGAVMDHGGRVAVDGTMQTSTPGIYAVGDLAPTPQLRHLAAREGLIAALHAAGRRVQSVRHDTIPRALDTWPQVASVGLTASQARSRGHLVAEGRSAPEAPAGVPADLPAGVPEVAPSAAPSAAPAASPSAGVAEAGAFGSMVRVVLDAESERLVGVHARGDGAERLACACATLLEGSLSDPELALAGAGPLSGAARAALAQARQSAPSVRTHTAAELERRPQRRLTEEAG